jgi:hypothetical protein
MAVALMIEGDGSCTVGRVEMRVKGKRIGRSSDVSGARASYA